MCHWEDTTTSIRRHTFLKDLQITAVFIEIVLTTTSEEKEKHGLGEEELDFQQERWQVKGWYLVGEKIHIVKGHEVQIK